MANDAIGREEVLAAIAIRAAEMRMLERMMESCGDDIVKARLDAKLEELEWLSELVVRRDSMAPVGKGNGDGE